MITKDIRARLHAAQRAIHHQAMSRDRGRLIGLFSRWKAKPEDVQAQSAFQTALQHSQRQRQQRGAQTPTVNVDESLPIAAQAQAIVQHIIHHQVIVIAGETGSGKTTQLPKLCLAAQRGVAGMIGCTQPRRIAARAVASRVAEELQTPLGEMVGYQVRFSDKVSVDSRIKFMTDGILLAETASDRWLSHYDTLIIDEAHERSLNIDFLLGYLKTLLPKRPDLKLIITSATIDTQRFSEHFNHAPVIHVEGRTWPVTIRYRPPEDNHLIESIALTVDEITTTDPHGDILIFLSGEREIRDANQALDQRNYRHTEVLPLYARLSAKDQDRVFNPGSQRRLVLATNVAETSLTVPRIRYVIDPGQARIKRYSPRQKLDRLHIEPISQASANQRSGRCGRVAEGICYRLYDEADFISRPQFTDPEIHRCSLAGVILRMLQLRLGEIEDFPFLQPPQTRAIADGWQQLTELGAIDKQRKLTAIGREMARLPVDVKLARMLVAAQHKRCLHAMLVISSFLGVSDPRERPPENRAAADQAHARFNDGLSEFVGILRLWQAYKNAHEALTQNKLRQWCQQNFLGFLRMREWRELHRQLHLLCEELGWENGDNDHLSQLLLSAPVKKIEGDTAKLTRGQLHRASRLAREGKSENPIVIQNEETNQSIDPKAQAAAYQTLHRAILAGLPTQIGQRNDKGDYQAPRQRRFQLFPGSALAKKPPAWVLSATLLDTQKIWGLTNAAIEMQWVLEELPHLLTHKPFDPYWSPARGQVMACEQVSLFGLILEPKRNINYGIINSEHAHELFIRQALVTGQIKSRAEFIKENLAILDQALEEEARQRRSGIVNDEQWQAQWYAQKIPKNIYSSSALDAWWKTLSSSEKQTLFWSLEDLLPSQSNNETAYPEYFLLGKEKLKLSYHFEPGADDDGVSLEVPLHLLPLLDKVKLSWLVPGLVAEKAESLIRSLPKTLRRNCVPAPEFANAFADAYLQPTNEDIKTELSRFLSKITGAIIHTEDFDESQLETYLKINICLLDKAHKLLATSRDFDSLRTRFSQAAQLAFSQHANPILTTESLREFPAESIAEKIIGPTGLPAYPALVDCTDRVALRLFADSITAKENHEKGVQCLLEIALENKIKKAQKQLPITEKTGLAGTLLESQQQLRSNLVYAALQALLVDDSASLSTIRSLDQFSQKCNEIGKKLFAKAMELLQLTQSILLQFAELKPQLKAVNNARVSVEDIQKQLDSLLYPGFLRHTPASILAQFPRYLKAISMRLERAQRDPLRDEKRINELSPFLQALQQAKQQGNAEQASWQALRWDIEELRVSLFAQELASRHGISVKKLMQRLAVLQK